MILLRTRDRHYNRRGGLSSDTSLLSSHCPCELNGSPGSQVGWVTRSPGDTGKQGMMLCCTVTSVSVAKVMKLQLSVLEEFYWWL